MDYPHLKDRVRAAREYARLSQDQLATAVGMRQQSFAALESGETRSSRKLTQIAIRCGVSPVWLATGEGQMIQSQAMRDWSGKITSRRDELGLSTQEVHASITNYAQRAGIPPPSLETVGNWFLGTERPMEMFIPALYEALRIDLADAAKDVSMTPETAEEVEALRQFRAMTAQRRQAQLLLWKAERGGGE